MQHTEERFLRDAHKGRDRDTQRRALVRLLELSHSENTDGKKFAAANFKHYIALFPDLEDDVINAIYDLCEDQASLVRIQGYQAIAAVSKQDSKWVKRNADVLVQLLQSDEPDEIFYIRKGLDEHLDLAPIITIGVLCDQLTSLDELTDDEDQLIRDRLRTLVLGFLSERMKKIISFTKDEPGSEPENVLVDGVIKAIPKSGLIDTYTIVKDILLCLPSYKYRSPEGEKVLLLVLDKAERALGEELLAAKPGLSALEQTRSWLELAGLVVGRVNSLTPDAQLFAFHNIITFVDGYSEIDRSNDAQEARRRAWEHSRTLLQILTDAQVSDPKSWKACRVLLKVCVERQKESQQCNLPRDVTDSIVGIQKMVENQQEKMDMDYLQDVHDLIRSLLQGGPVKLNPASTDSTPGGSWRPSKRKYDSELDRFAPRQGVPSNAPRRDRPSSSTSEVLERPRSPKRPKNEEREDGQPSLLSRLDPSREQSNGSTPRYTSPIANPNIPSVQRANRAMDSSQRKPMQLPPSLPKKPDVPMPDIEDDDHTHPVKKGLNIKGAASRQTDTNGNGRNRRGTPPARFDSFSAPWEASGESLLERLHDDQNVGKRKRGRGPRYQ